MVSQAAILYGAQIVTCNSTDIVVLRNVDAGIAEGQVLHSATCSDVGEQTHTIYRLIHSDAAEGLAVAVEGSIERMSLVTYDDVVVLFRGAVTIVPSGSTFIVDVVV